MEEFIYKPENTHGEYGYLELKSSVGKPNILDSGESDEVYHLKANLWKKEQELIRKSIIPVSEELYDHNDEKLNKTVLKHILIEGKDFIIKHVRAYPVKDILDELLEETSLESKIKTLVIMHDYENWDNGDYKGKMHEVVPSIMEEIKKE